jgi:hypothetical protein
MTDQEVIELYRCLLGRPPEAADTIKAFKGYYPTFERGRKAVFDSNEFQNFYAKVTGHPPFRTENEAASLALAFLARLAAAAAAPPVVASEDPVLRAGFLAIFRKLGRTRLAVVVGDPNGVALDDLVPLERPEAAILHIAPGFPPAVPLVGRLRDGTTLFRLGGDAESVAGFLRQNERRIDALFLLGRPAGVDWVDELRGVFAPLALVTVGRPDVNFNGAAVSAAITAAHFSEPVQDFCGFRLHHFGGWLLPVKYAQPALVPAAPDLAAFPKLAIATMVRNEAVCIENMLRSAAPVASFLAVLDTGSSDGTQALAKKFLAGSGKQYAFAEKSRAAFNDDFSAMRNAVLDMVPEWVDWVLMLDADEALAPEDYLPILALTASGTHDAYALPRYNFPGAGLDGEMISYPDRQVRLLRQKAKLRYEGRVHETVQSVASGRPPLDASAVGGPRGGPHIHHLVRRFRTAEQEARKQAFYREIAQRSG